jgi:repressor LexA
MTVTVLDQTWKIDVWPANPEQDPNAVYLEVTHTPRHGDPKPPISRIRFGLTEAEVNRIAHALIEAVTDNRATEILRTIRENAERVLVGRTLASPQTKEAPPASNLSFSKTQGRYLAFIHRYITKFGQAPAEADIQRHFLVSAPSVNAMMQTLTRKGLISRVPGVPRSIKLLVSPDLLPSE